MTIPQNILDAMAARGAPAIKTYEKIRRFRTGILPLDWATNGGLPVGNYTFFIGEEGTGKTTLCTLIALATKNQGGSVFFLDVERKFNYVYAMQSGLGRVGEDFVVSYPATAESAFEAIRAIAKASVYESGSPPVTIIVDSWAALSPRDEVAADDISNASMGVFARLSGKFFRVVSDDLALSNVTVVVTNQIRDTMNSYKFKGQNVSITTAPGGKAQRYWPALLVDLNKPKPDDIEWDESKKQPVGMTINGTVKKNSYGPSRVEFSAPVRFATGSYFDGGVPYLHTNIAGETIQYGRDLNILTKEDGSPIRSSNAKHFFGDKYIGTGNAQVQEFLEGDRETLALIREEIYKVIDSMFTVRTE